MHQTLIVREDVLVGATLVGDAGTVAALTQAFDSRSPLPAQRIRLLVDVGPAGGHRAADLPDDARICHCNAVSKRALVACVEGGETTVPGCMAATRAGTGCGSCRGLVTEVVESTVAALSRS